MSRDDKVLWPRLSPLLDEMLDLDEPARAARLARLRIDDPELAPALERMLGHLPAIERDGFLETPAVPRPDGLAGQAVGAYTLDRELGHGGMGTVWLAHRTDGRYEGQVAIKFLRAGMFGHGDAARFQREGSILARLAHPHIARLLDAGVAAEGNQPFLVLEYIDGEPIDVYCARLALGVAPRLKLFLDVLAAVAHAHNRLILHRDLKPSNILVTTAGEVKLLDFGIAKLLDETGMPATMTELTLHAGNAFTPQFAAPEQLQGGDVTTATDVYALGVLLYMLLGGEHPTVPPTGATLDRMRAVIEMEPRRLSESVLRRGAAQATGSAAALASSRKLAGELRGDIDTIVARALKKVPGQRYANAADLADDIRRYLAHEPIAARPDARLYRVAKFVRRNRGAVAAGTAAAIAIGVGVGVALWQAREARAQRVQAEGLIEFMLGDLHKKLQPVGRLDVLDSVGDKALAYYAQQDPDRLDADSLGRRARALHLIGDLAEQRGKLDEAERDFKKAADSTAELLQRHPDDGQRLFDQSQSEYWVGYIQWRRGRLREAEASFRRYDALAERMTRLAPDNLDWRMEKIYAEENIAIVLRDLGRPQETLAIAGQARTGVLALLPARPDLAVEAANIVGWIARAHEDLGELPQAIAAVREKVALARQAPDVATNRDAQYLFGTSEVEMGRLQLKQGDVAAAIASARAGLAAQEQLAASDASNLDWLFEAEAARVQLADTLYWHGDLAEARALDAHAAGPLARLMSAPVPKRDWRVALTARVAALHGRLAQSPEERAEALRGLSTFLADLHRFEADGSQITIDELAAIVNAEIVQGDLLAAAGQADAAGAAWRDGLRRLATRQPPAGAVALRLQALLELRLGDTAQARAHLDALRRLGDRHPALRDVEARLSR